MIASFGHKGLEALFRTGSKRGVQPQHAAKLLRMLDLLDSATCANDLMIPGYKTHMLRGELDGHWAMWVSGNWRLTFQFVGQDVELVNYRDYH